MARTDILRIGEYHSLAAAPLYHALKRAAGPEHWVFIPGGPTELDHALERDQLDLTLASPLLAASAPLDYLVLPGLGYGAKRHVRDMLLFSDMLLDDMDEMTISLPGPTTATAMLQLLTNRYLQFQNQFIMGWGNAEAFLLAGDAALRERLLARYAYVYDLGDLWRHYTGQAMIYSLWMLKKETWRRKKSPIVAFERALRLAIAGAAADFKAVAASLAGYEWIKPAAMTQLWGQINFELLPAHYDGLDRFFEECAEGGLIEEPPELEYAEV
jgi:chorismate dehydratase